MERRLWISKVILFGADAVATKKDNPESFEHTIAMHRRQIGNRGA